MASPRKQRRFSPDGPRGPKGEDPSHFAGKRKPPKYFDPAQRVQQLREREERSQFTFDADGGSTIVAKRYVLLRHPSGCTLQIQWSDLHEGFLLRADPSSWATVIPEGSNVVIIKPVPIAGVTVTEDPVVELPEPKATRSPHREPKQKRELRRKVRRRSQS